MKQPMLAATADPDEDLDRLSYPRLVSPKLDGIRAVAKGGQLLSRRLKPIPNLATQAYFGDPRFSGMDGELVVGDPTDAMVFNRSSRGVMSKDGDPQAVFYLFDVWSLPGVPYDQRLDWLLKAYRLWPKKLRERTAIVDQQLVMTPDELLAAETKYLDMGYEGIMSRSIAGKYKDGRSTLREGWLVKHKRFVDGEARVLECYPRMHNTNEAKLDETGHAKRSSHKAGKVATDVLGRMLVHDTKTDTVFELGAGTMTLDEARQAWADWTADSVAFCGRIAKYAHFAYGAKDKPRLPVFKGWRDPIDM
jgi:DNA ligase-1